MRPGRHRAAIAPAGPRECCPEDGSAVVEYVLVSTLLVLIFLGVGQVALVLHARNVLVAEAAEGARTAATRGATPADGERFCDEEVGHALSAALSSGADGPCRATLVSGDGVHPPLVRMRVRTTLPLTFIPLGTVSLDVTARAVLEPR